MRAYLFVAVLLLLIFGGIAGYLFNKFSVLASTDFSPPPVTIAAATAQSAIWPSELEAVGTIRAARGVELSAETSGEVIEIFPAAEVAAAAHRAEDIPLDVLYEDDALLVVNKPAGLVVHPGSGIRDGTLLNALLQRVPGLAAIPRAGIVHRLDKDTSGLLVVAKTLPAQASLVRQLQEDPGVRVQVTRLGVADAEVSGVEERGVGEEAAVTAAGPAGHRRDAVAAGEKVPPELLRAVGVREPAGHPDDRDVVRAVSRGRWRRWR